MPYYEERRLLEGRRLFQCGYPQVWRLLEEIRHSRATTKTIPLLQLEPGFCQQNGSERRQAKQWYPNEKLVVIPVCLNGRRCSSGCVGIVLYRQWVSVSSQFSKRCCQCNFSGIFKGRQIIPRPCRNSKYPFRCLSWWCKTLQDVTWMQAYSKPLQASIYFFYLFFIYSWLTANEITVYNKKIARYIYMLIDVNFQTLKKWKIVN